MIWSTTERGVFVVATPRPGTPHAGARKHFCVHMCANCEYDGKGLRVDQLTDQLTDDELIRLWLAPPGRIRIYILRQAQTAL